MLTVSRPIPHLTGWKKINGPCSPKLHGAWHLWVTIVIKFGWMEGRWSEGTIKYTHTPITSYIPIILSTANWNSAPLLCIINYIDWNYNQVSTPLFPILPKNISTKDHNRPNQMYCNWSRILLSLWRIRL